MTGNLTGIDLNGLCDVSVDGVEGDVLRGGDVPSVVVVQPRQDGEAMRVIAGVEAAMAIEGRGWHWPNSSRVTEVRACLRVPVQQILHALAEGNLIEAAGKSGSPTELLAAAIEALARPRERAVTPAEERMAVIAVPDEGRFLEEARQRLIDAAIRGGLTPTLLWRPVAAILGLELELLADDIHKLSDRTVGVMSCLEDGVHAARLQIEVETDEQERSYFIPVRDRAGIIVPYRRPIGDLAAELARRHAPDDDPQAGWQLLWGDGLVLRWLLRLPAKDTVVQTGRSWQHISGQAPEDLPQVEFDETAIRDLDKFLEGVDYRIFEGPALETTAYGIRLVYFLKDRVAKTADSLNFATKNEYLVARGCAVYQRRREQGRHTYFDHLPQLRLAVRRGTDPDFLELIDRSARVEGGSSYDVKRDLGLSVQPGTTSLNFFLLREGNAKPRHVRVELPERVNTATPIRLHIRQQPAQGTARLTLVAAEDDSFFRPVELHWEYMTEEDLTEQEVLERLRDEPADVPPVHSQPCHALMWTSPVAVADGSLVLLLPLLAALLDNGPPKSGDLLPLVTRHSVLLTRRSSPARLTRRQTRDWTLYRAVSSEGNVPEPDNNLTSGLLEQFDTCLRGLDNLIASEIDIERRLRTAIIRLGGWCFLRCPEGIRSHLLSTARHGSVPDHRVYYRAMGKVFASREDWRAFFDLLEQQLSRRDAKFKMNEIEGLFYLLSLREQAPLALTDYQATLFANMLLARIQECVRAPTKLKLSRLVSVSLKTYAGLMRYRLVRPDYMTRQDFALGEKQHQILEKLLQRSHDENRVQITRLTENLIKWSEKRGTDTTILQWDPNDNDIGDDVPDNA